MSVILSEKSVWIIRYTFISQVTVDQFTKAKESSFSLKNFNYHLPNLSGFTELSKAEKKNKSETWGQEMTQWLKHYKLKSLASIRPCVQFLMLAPAFASVLQAVSSYIAVNCTQNDTTLRSTTKLRVQPLESL